MAMERFDFAAKMKARLVTMYRGKPKMEALIDALAAEIQEAEDALQQLATLPDIDVSVGAQLDGLERLVGQTRFKFSDPEVRRAWIRASIVLNRSSGAGNDVLNVFLAVLPSPLFPVLEEAFPAGLKVRAAGGALDPALAPHLGRMLKLAKAAGVGVRFLWQPGDDSDTFRFADPDFNRVATVVTSIPSGSVDPFVIRGVYGPWLAYFTGSFEEFDITIDPSDLNGHYESAHIVSVGSFGGGYYIIPDSGAFSEDHDAGEQVLVTIPVTTENAGKGFADVAVPGSGGQFAGVI